jgi:hypothetical protein|uniref:Uncharacterized protein n=1 Tax=Siphoviridae sp. ctX926 TaxID=2826366 RepID=A0A8S5M182_9CAUD|nr:MAG TPA: hypothetical protein [Siphoviridae sp. ctX926]
MRRRMLMDLIFGGDSVKYEGTFTGNGTTEITIPMDFEPDYIYVKRTNLQIDVNAAYGCAILRDMYSGASYTTANLTNIVNGGFVYDIDGLYGNTTMWATHSSGNLTLHLSPANRLLADGEEYKIICGKFA